MFKRKIHPRNISFWGFSVVWKVELRRKRIIFSEWKAGRKCLVNKKELSENWQIALSDNNLITKYEILGF